MIYSPAEEGWEFLLCVLIAILEAKTGFADRRLCAAFRGELKFSLFHPLQYSVLLRDNRLLPPLLHDIDLLSQGPGRGSRYLGLGEEALGVDTWLAQAA